MIEISAEVVRIEGETAWVATRAPASCGACGGKGCGSSVLTRLWHREEPDYPVLNTLRARVGDAVVVGVPDGVLLRASLAAYSVPLAGVVAGALAGAGFGDAGAVVGAVTGFSAAALWLRRRRTGVRPAILRLGDAVCTPRN